MSVYFNVERSKVWGFWNVSPVEVVAGHESDAPAFIVEAHNEDDAMSKGSTAYYDARAFNIVITVKPEYVNPDFKAKYSANLFKDGVYLSNFFTGTEYGKDMKEIKANIIATLKSDIATSQIYFSRVQGKVYAPVSFVVME